MYEMKHYQVVEVEEAMLAHIVDAQGMVHIVAEKLPRQNQQVNLVLANQRKRRKNIKLYEIKSSNLASFEWGNCVLHRKSQGYA
jgi:TfoX/Sxy family transcriptional regulator of competence genes